MKRSRLSLLLSIALLISVSAAALPALAKTPSASDADALIIAAQQEDVAQVKALLEAGVPIDSPSEYGATALFFAADKGNVELVKVLLKAGANVNVTDTFYNATPLLWALSKATGSEDHREIAVLLLQAGAGPADAVLNTGIGLGDLDLVRAALASDQVTAETRRRALARLAADEATPGKDEIAALLAKDLPVEAEGEAPAAIELSAEDRAKYVGEYSNDDIGMKIKVFVEGDQLKGQATGQPPLTLDATGPSEFTVREVDGIDLSFQGRGGLIERLLLSQGGQELIFGRVEAEIVEQVAETPSLPEAERGPGKPWPSFRGANASGIGDGQGIPFEWNGEAGTNIRWKTPIPGIALASPVIWGDRVFVTSAVSEDADTTFRTGLYGDVDSVEDDSVHTWRVYALDRATGEILWQHDASQGRPKVKRHFKSSHANSSPVVTENRLVVLFPSEGLFCYDHEGKLLWKKDLGVFGSGWFFDSTYEWGFAASPILHDGKVIVQADIYSGSYIAAWDVDTGEQVWRTERDEKPTWSTPSILPAEEGNGAEIVTNGKIVRGYDAETGKELWTLSPNSEIVVGTPVVADGIAYVTGGYPPARPIYAIRPGGRGDLTLADDEESNETIAWRDERGGTYIPTPIAYQNILYMFHNNGRLAAYDAKSGEMLYRKRVGQAESFAGSPVAADGRLLFTSETGTTYVVRSGKVFAELGENDLGEVVMTTPAISDGLLVIRGMEHVYGIATEGDAADAKDEMTMESSESGK